MLLTKNAKCVNKFLFTKDAKCGAENSHFSRTNTHNLLCQNFAVLVKAVLVKKLETFCLAYVS